MKAHPIADLLPLLAGEEFRALVASIAANGLREPITLTPDGLILDGRNRYAACLAAEVEPRTVVYDGDPLTFVIDENVRRRHLNESQRAMFAARLADMPKGTRTDLGPIGLTSQPAAATQLNVSVRSVKRAAAVQREAEPEVIAAVDAGDLPVSRAVRQIKEQRREAERLENHVEVQATPDIHSLCGGNFRTIVIDPPWDWGDEGDQDQLGRARPTYATMPFAELAALPLLDICDRDAHLYLWITNRSLPKGFALLDAWGFRYITALTWCKPHFGMGNYFRGQTEHVLFGVRGSLPLRRKDVGTWFAATRPAGHSSKPPELTTLVESCSPGPYLELFARAPREGWTVWGAEA
jgi:N6-adenosine-specific RNA methylase IME4